MLAIGFDFDHTLGIDHELERMAYLELAAELAPATRANGEEGRATAAIDRELTAYRSGEKSLDQAIGSAFTATLGPSDYVRAIEMFRERSLALASRLVEPLPGVETMLRGLASRELPHAILTNGWSPLQERKAQLIGYDHPVLVSDVIGARKPARGAFEALCRTLNARSESVWYVGDDPAVDISGSLAAGLQAIWFDWERKAYPHHLAAPTMTIKRMQDLLELIDAAVERMNHERTEIR
jgi:FMN phosphatase YigB (HAD superfamily)